MTQPTPLNTKMPGEHVREQAMALVEATPAEIRNVEDYEAVAAHLRDLSAATNQLEAQRTSESKPHFDRHKAVIAEFKPTVDAVAQVIVTVKRLMSDWNREQQRIAAEREAEARRKAAEEAAVARRKQEEAAG